MRKTRKKLKHNSDIQRNSKLSKVFEEKDYTSGDGFLTTVWGPLAWTFLHTISFNYPVEPSKEDKENYRNFVLSLVNILPCKYCRDNLKKNFKIMPLTIDVMKNRNTFSKYMYDLHELVNKNLGKVSGLSYEDVREMYEHFRARCSIDKNKNKTQKLRNTIKNKINNKGNKTMSKKNKIIKEKGCTEPLYGKKAKSIIKIVPRDKKCMSFQIDKECIKRRIKL